MGTEEVALQLGMGPEWVRCQVQAGRLRARIFTVGGRRTYRITQAAIDEFLAKYSIDAPGDGVPVDPKGRRSR